MRAAVAQIEARLGVEIAADGVDSDL
jgi:hypothetical protein